MKTMVATYAYQRSDFIHMQRDCLQRYLKEPHEYVVFNNTPDGPASSAINDTCAQHGIRCVRVNGMSGDIGSHSHATALNWSFRNVILPEGCDYLLMLDFDMFLMSEFSVAEFLADHAFSGVPQSNGQATYYWPGMLLLKMGALPNKHAIDFSCGHIPGHGQVDSGGFLYFYIRDNPTVPVRNMKHTCQIATPKHFSDFFVSDISDKYGSDFGFEVYAEKFLHYGRGSNWNRNPQEFVDRKTALLNEIFRRRMGGENIYKK